MCVFNKNIRYKFIANNKTVDYSIFHGDVFSYYVTFNACTLRTFTIHSKLKTRVYLDT